jgi:hypothetical protein
MEIDDRFPTKLPSVLDAPERFRSALADSISSQESIHFLIHAPAFSTLSERTSATVLTVTDKGWFIVSETEDGAADLEKSDFDDTLFQGMAMGLRIQPLHRGSPRRALSAASSAGPGGVLFRSPG